jgi:CRP/FNR family transcriptional regulator, cyclic AMP receptor protein
MAGDAKVEALRAMSLFSDLRERDLKQVAQLADEVDLPAGHVLMREGDRGSEAFLLATGEVKVELAGREIARLGPGTMLGEMAILAEGPRTATVTLTQPSRLFVLAHREFHSLLDDVPAVRKCVLDELVRRLRTLEPDKAL